MSVRGIIAEQLHIEVALFDFGREVRSQFGDVGFGVLFAPAVLFHDHSDAIGEAAEFEDDAEAAKNGDLEFFLAAEFTEVAAAARAVRDAAVVDQNFLEGVEVDGQVETVGAVSGDNDVDLIGVDRRVVRLLQELLNARHDLLLELRALAGRIVTGDEKVGVGAEGLVGFVQPKHADRVLLLTPVVEIAEQPAGFEMGLA